MKVSLKVSFREDIRRISLDHRPNLSELEKIIKKMYNIECFQLKYVDEDQDEVTIGSEEELEQAFTSSPNLLRLFVKPPPASQSMADFGNIGNSMLNVNFDKSMPNLGEVLSNPIIDMISSSVLSQIKPHLDRFRDASQLLSASFINNYNHPQNPEQLSEIKVQEKEEPKKVEEVTKEVINLVPINPAPVELPLPENKPVVDKKYSCKYIRDVTIKDLTQIEHGTKFTKEWLLQNDGDTQWPEGTCLKLISGDSIVADGVQTVPIPLAKVGEEVSVEFPLVAPKPGRYTTYFRVMLPDGVPMPGSRFWTDFISTPQNLKQQPQPIRPQPVPQPAPQPAPVVPLPQPVPQPAPQPAPQEEIPHAYRDGVKCLEDMGFDRKASLAALKRANGDIMRAIDILSG